MCFSRDMNFFLLGFSNGVLIFDWGTKTLLRFKKVDYLSDLQLIQDDSKIVITTWTAVIVDGFQESLRGE